MKRTTGVIAASLVIALMAPMQAAKAQGHASLTSSGASFDLRDCPIGRAAKSCVATPLTIAAGMPYGSSCVFDAGYTGGGAQAGVCAVDDGLNKAGTVRVNVVKAEGCAMITIERNGQYASLVRLTDGVEDRWTLTTLRINTVAYEHDGRTGQDHWVVDSLRSVAQFQNAGGRVVTLTLAGTLRSSSNCAANVAASSFVIDVLGAGPIS